MGKIKLSEISSLPPEGTDEKLIRKETAALVKRFGKLQNQMYAENKHSLLVIFQGMDASGKDGAARKVFRSISPTGVTVKSFKKPTDLEFAHDFLWRVHQAVPEKGMITIFNRSHYEDILIQRVHNWIDEARVKQRMKHINNFESLLQEENNTKILKFYLHVSKDRQHERLMERRTNSQKHWKHNDGDWKEREHWDKYMAAYEDCFENCSPEIPWIIIPCNENYYKEYLIAKNCVAAIESMNLTWPALESELS